VQIGLELAAPGYRHRAARIYLSILRSLSHASIAVITQPIPYPESKIIRIRIALLSRDGSLLRGNRIQDSHIAKNTALAGLYGILDTVTVDLRASPEEEAFRLEAREWFGDNFVDPFDALRGRGGQADEELWDLSVAWERHLASHGWLGLGWPTEFGGKGAGPMQQVIFQEEYARSGAPPRITHLGEMMLGPTLIHLGSTELQQRFLPGILAVDDLWCQGYSEPDAGSDLAGVRTKAELVGDEWVITGQKTWTSLAHHADFCFVLCRTDPNTHRHGGISYLLVPMNQAEITVRSIRQISGATEFNDVFFDGARAPADWIVGPVNGGWGIAMATLGFERSRRLASFPGMHAEFQRVLKTAQTRNKVVDPVIRDRLAQSYVELMVMRATNLRTISAMSSNGSPGAAASIGKLFWSLWHQELTEIALDIEGMSGIAGGGVTNHSSNQAMFLHARAETIYAGSSEIQRNILGERVLGLPKD
jgi:alkylation response protein AidB-like acyl-CoA dehydrogenase